MLRTLGILLLVVVFCLGASVGYFNTTPVDFDYLFGTVQMRLILLLLLVFVVAAILTWLLCGYRLINQRGEIRRLRRQLRASETELKNLRNLPLKGT